MTKSEMVDLVKKNLKIEDDSRDLSISDVINNVVIYCNLNEKYIPDQLEPFIRKKVSNMISYEDTNGSGYHRGIASIKEGDGTITYVSSADGASEEDDIYGLSSIDKIQLQAFRRLRGYA